MSEPDYTLEGLIKTFHEHAEHSDKHMQENMARFKENFPDAELPDHFKEKFNISRALAQMAFEIDMLKTCK